MGKSQTPALGSALKLAFVYLLSTLSMVTAGVSLLAIAMIKSLSIAAGRTPNKA
jgi:hypothetical protein